jgi:hypothetical protein
MKSIRDAIAADQQRTNAEIEHAERDARRALPAQFEQEDAARLEARRKETKRLACN